MDRENIFNHCQTILQETNDGNDLKNSDLSLVEAGVNGFLSPRGEVVLYQLAHKVSEGLYDSEPDWFFGIENLTRGKGDDRSVFWSGIRVEHFDHDFWQSDGWRESMKKDAEQVAKTCQYMEENSIEVTFNNYMDNCGRFRT
jgi:hypothetical protein